MSEHIISDRQLGLIQDFATVCVEGEKLESIIRCADCAYRDPERELYGKGWCRTNVRYVRDKDFCAWAEPKDETLALPRREC